MSVCAFGFSVVTSLVLTVFVLGGDVRCSTQTLPRRSSVPSSPRRWMTHGALLPVQAPSHRGRRESLRVWVEVGVGAMGPPSITLGATSKGSKTNVADFYCRLGARVVRMTPLASGWSDSNFAASSFQNCVGLGGRTRARRSGSQDCLN